MRLEFKEQMIVNVPADKLWQVVAHQFDQIGLWSSGIAESHATNTELLHDGANMSGRVCLADGSGSDVEEVFTRYDEAGRSFSYKAVGQMPWFINDAENNWHVRSIGPEQAEVGFNGQIDSKLLPGILFLIFKPLVKKVWGTRTLEELKHYVETGLPHPRKVKAMAK